MAYLLSGMAATVRDVLPTTWLLPETSSSEPLGDQRSERIHAASKIESCCPPVRSWTMTSHVPSGSVTA